jgi:hypothetical protein
MRKGFVTLLAMAVAVAVAGCGNGSIYVRDGVTDGDTFYLADQAFMDRDPVLQSWVAYSLSRSACQLEIGGPNPARVSDYGCEFSARQLMLDTWEENLARDPSIRHGYLDDLVRVREAGFLDEYVVNYYGDSEWQVPIEVDVPTFVAWQRDNLRGHKPETRIIGSWNFSEHTLHSAQYKPSDESRKNSE